MRPPLSQERLEWRPDGSLELTLKNVWKDGTRALVLEPFDLLVRLCSAIPPSWFNMIRYFGGAWMYVKSDAAKGQGESLSVLLSPQGRFQRLVRKPVD